MFLQVDLQAFIDEGFDDAFDLAIAELGLSLPLKLRLRDFDADDTRQTLANVVAL